MRYLPAALFAVGALTATARADSFDTITFSFPVTTIPLPFGQPPDVVSAINRSFNLPASPTPVAEPFFISPGTFWIDPFGNPPGAFPPPGDMSFYFSPAGEGFVFTQNINSPRAYSNFQSAQLFTGPATAPTFLPGTYTAQFSVPVFGYGYDFGTITIAPDAGSPVPEPASLALVASGALGAVSLLCRRFTNP